MEQKTTKNGLVIFFWLLEIKNYFSETKKDMKRFFWKFKTAN